MAAVAHNADSMQCKANRTGSSVHKCQLCMPVEPMTNLRTPREMGAFVLELGELVKLGECTSREFSRAINVAKWSPHQFDDCFSMTDAVDTALSLVRIDPKLGNYETHE